MIFEAYAKLALKEELISVLQSDLEKLERAYDASKAGATHEEAKPENDKDTRALEQSYLARGQARRVEALRECVANVQNMSLRPFDTNTPIALGALVRVLQDEDERLLFVAPEGGGTSLSGATVQVVTARSPMGQALVGKRVGDVCEVNVAGRVRELEVVDVV